MSDEKVTPIGKIAKVVELHRSPDTSVAECMEFLHGQLEHELGVSKLIFVVADKNGTLAHGYSQMSLTDLMALTEWLKDSIKADAREDESWP